MQILAKISEIASWSKCTEVGAMNGRTCWLVQPEILERYNLSNLSVVNTWSSTETKKRGRKADDAKNEEDTPPPPSKTARTSLIKKFRPKPVAASPSSQPMLNSTPTPSDPVVVAEPSPSPSSTHKASKKRVALISLPSTPTTKKPRSESKTTPLTSFLKKMGSGKETPPKSSLPKQPENDHAMNVDPECYTIE